MRNTICTSAIVGSILALAVSTAGAQTPAPAAKPEAAPAAKQLKVVPSPAAKVSQQVGTTEVAVEYSSPGVKKRKIWGELVPYDKPWRTGANASTKITFSKDVSLAGKPIPAGTYNLLTIPSKKAWTVIINKDTTIGGNMDKYSEAQDVARVSVTPKAGPARERLTFIFSDVTDDSASLDLEWEKVKLSIPIKASAS